MIITAPYDAEQVSPILVPRDYATSDLFGGSVALSKNGRYMAVGAPGWTGSLSTQGCVYVFEKVGRKWTPRTIAGASTGIVTASDAASADNFGSGVAFNSDGTVMVVGASGWEGAFSGQGGVYVYDWDGTQYVMRGSVLEAADAAASDKFGISVALSSDGTVLVVGASGVDNTAVSAGAFYTYDWSGAAWVQRGSRVLLDPTNDEFGDSVALSGDGAVLAVGAAADSFSATSNGVVHIYDDVAGTWVKRADTLYAQIPTNYSRYGDAVALSDDGSILAVGCSYGEYFIESTTVNRGFVDIRRWNGTSWSFLLSYLYPDNSLASDTFGEGLALDDTGCRLVVGATGDETTQTTNTGSLYTYDAYLYAIAGTVLDDTGTGVARTLAVYERDTGRLVGGGVSSASDGSFQIGVATNKACYVVSLDDTAGVQYNDLVYDLVMPYVS